ncbi:MAG: ATP-binding protein, partial [Sulfurospirillum sp.]|nr:ATP-binding protein [Sulfurospirillum sp.]
MKILENLYDIKHKNHHYRERKLTITSKKTIINGVKKSGKTCLILDYLSNFDQDKVLYIDFNDTRVDVVLVKKNLKKFIESKPIAILVIENFDNSFELPLVEECILTCKEEIAGFEILTLYPLDFEEFVSFEQRHLDIDHLFQLYINTGSYPQIILNSSHNMYWSMQEMLHVILDDVTEFEIFKKLSESQSLKISLFQIFNQLKSTIKISKDSLYKKVAKLESEKMIFLVKKYGSTKSNKKLFLIDFALKNALTFKKEFLKKFENIVFLELMKKNYTIYYSDNIDLYIPKKQYGVLCIPFLPQEMIKLKLQKILPHVKEL